MGANQGDSITTKKKVIAKSKNKSKNKSTVSLDTKLSDMRKSRGLDDKDILIIYAKMSNPSWTLRQIGEEVGLSINSVFKRLHTSRVEETIEDLTEDITYLLTKAKVRAARRMSKLIGSDVESIALAASRAVLQSELQPHDIDSGATPIRFITVINEMGVLESGTVQETIDITADDAEEDDEPSIDT